MFINHTKSKSSHTFMTTSETSISIGSSGGQKTDSTYSRNIPFVTLPFGQCVCVSVIRLFMAPIELRVEYGELST